MPDYVGAIDQGTTSTRFIVFNRAGQMVATAQKEHEQIYPQPGWVEHSPAEIWARTQEVIAEAMQSKGLTASDLAAVGITNQRETTVVWNRKTGQAVYNAIVWQDTRVSNYVDEIVEAGRAGPLPRQDRTAAGDLLQRTEDSLDSGERARRARAGRSRRSDLRQHRHFLAVEPDGRAQRRHSRHRRDQRQPHSVNESRNSGVGRIYLRCSAFRPRCCRASRRAARCMARSALGPSGGRSAGRRLGRSAGRAGGADVFRAGTSEEHVRHGLFSAAEHSDKPVHSKFGLLTTVAYQFGKQPAHYALEGSVAITGALVQWLRDNLKPDRQQRRDRRRWRDRSKTMAASISCRRSPDCTRRTGSPARAA